MLDAGLARFIHDVLDQRPVDHRQHLFWHGLGRRQEARAETGYGKDSFADEFHAVPLGEERERETLCCLNLCLVGISRAELLPDERRRGDGFDHRQKKSAVNNPVT
jgi:hypothetical protein